VCHQRFGGKPLMHKNYDYVLSPSKKTAKFYMEAFGCDNSKIKICSLPRVDDILTDNNAASRFFTENPGLSHDKIVLYLLICTLDSGNYSNDSRNTDNDTKHSKKRAYLM
jgi:hypothetical protein